MVEHHNLLAGDQMDEQNPPRWLLVSREVGVPIEEGGGDWIRSGVTAARGRFAWGRQWPIEPVA